jgi:hypothetical protein
MIWRNWGIGFLGLSFSLEKYRMGELNIWDRMHAACAVQYHHATAGAPRPGQEKSKSGKGSIIEKMNKGVKSKFEVLN